MVMGVSYDEFWKLNPHILDIIQKSYLKKQKVIDRQMWMMGMYVKDAVGTVIDHALSGSKAKSKYMEKPILEELEEVNLTEEERYERDLRKALLVEDQWIANDIQRGLPKTTIK